MKPLDKNYLLLQFQNFIYSKSGTDFQSFFESVMGKAYPNFKKVPSGGGDGGNDGWIKEDGKYYQVYAPNVPAIKDSTAAEKLLDDFKKLSKNWNQVSEIKEYYFVYNDKYAGANKPEHSVAKLQSEYKDIKFYLFLSSDIERIFFELESSSILSLGFDIDQRDSVKNAYEFMETIEIELNKENTQTAYEILLNIKELINNISNDNLSLEFEILEGKCLFRLERFDEALVKLEGIHKRYPKNNKVLLILASLYLTNRDTKNNQLFLEKSEEIDKKNPSLILEKSVRRLFDGEDLSVSENILDGVDKKTKSIFLRLFARVSCNSGSYDDADSYIERAIHELPENLVNHIVKLQIFEKRIVSKISIENDPKIIELLIDKVNEFEESFCEGKFIGNRNKAVLSLIKLNAFKIRGNVSAVNENAEIFFNLILSCHYDVITEGLLCDFLLYIQMPESFLVKLLEHLRSQKMTPSDRIQKLIVIQLMFVDKLFTHGEPFFCEIDSRRYLDFISAIKDNEIKAVVDFVGDDSEFSVLIISALKKYREIKLSLLDNIPSDFLLEKDKVLFHIYYGDADYDLAFSIIRQMDFSKISSAESEPILHVIREKKAWDLEAIVLSNVIDLILDEEKKFEAKFQLFYVYLNLQCHKEIIDLGEKLLATSTSDFKYYECIIHNTIVACLERGKIDNTLFEKAKNILERYRYENLSYDFRVKVEVAVYLKNNDPENALKSIIDGIKRKKVLTADEYAKLFFALAVDIAEKVSLNFDSLDEVIENSFVKLEGKSKWYFIGSDNELDTVKITNDKPKYEVFMGAKKGESVSFDDRYGGGFLEEKIELIYSIDKYIFWRVKNDFSELSNDGDVEGVQLIRLPDNDPTDFDNLIKYMQDSDAGQQEFFKRYCEKLYPLSILAFAEGGLPNAVGRICREGKGFINFSDGTLEDIDNQKRISREIINGKLPFYIDGTSALFLSEMGLLNKIAAYIPNMKVPQSVINMLVKLADKFNFDESHKGYVFLNQGKLGVSLVERDKINAARENIISSIKILELNLQNISTISMSSKSESVSEVKTLPELCDACILAKRESIPVLTDDFIYLKYNSLDSGAAAPSYFSSFLLLRVLYEDGFIGFDEYLDYFSYLSSYRCRFLSLDSVDIEKAVLGDRLVKNIDPKAIGRFNFRLTLSPEYGVSFQTAASVIGNFLSKVVIDDSLAPNVLDRLLMEIMENISEKIDKSEFISEIFKITSATVKHEYSSILAYPSQLVIDKINGIKRMFGLYSRPRIWTGY